MGLLALAGVIPAVVLMGLFARYDAKRPEPRARLRWVALLGGLSTIPAIAIEEVLTAIGPAKGTVVGALFESFIVAALVEESCKALAMYLGAWSHRDFDERVDGIVYATRAGLGFALVENVGYLLDARTFTGLAWLFVVRSVLAVPGHALWTGFVGHWGAVRRFDGRGPGALGGLIIAVVLHGAYDGALFLLPVVGEDAPLLALGLMLVPFTVIIGGYLRLHRHAIESGRRDDEAHHRPVLPLGVGFVLR